MDPMDAGLASLSGSDQSVTTNLIRSLLVLVLALPWLWPVAIGPWPATLPWVVSLICVALTLLFVVWLRPDVPKAITISWLLAAATSGVIGLLQYFGWSAALAPFVSTTSLGEAFANLRQRNQFATLTNIGLVTLFAWLALPAAHRPGAMTLSNPDHAWWRWPVAVGVAVLLAVANAASSSRTGLLQLGLVVLMFGVWGLLRNRSVRLLLLAVSLAYGAAALILPWLAGVDPATTGILARLHDGAPACASRLTLWTNVLHLITLKPWLGWGWGGLDYAHFITLYAGPRFCDILDNGHNLPLHLAVELGVPVALAACGLCAWWVARARPWRETRPERQLAWAVLALILLHSLLEYPLWYGPFQIATGLSIWTLWATRPAPRSCLPAMRAPLTTAAVLILVAASYTAWDYHRVSQLYLASSQRAPAYRVNTFEKVRDSWLFARQVRFAELTTAELTAENSGYFNAMAHDLLYFSPEARVVEKLIGSAVLLGRNDEVAYYLDRYQAAFPAAHAQWLKARLQP
jgi:O-antigen ligase